MDKQLHPVNISLIALVIAMLALCGGGTYEAINVMPQLTAAPPTSLAMLEGEFGFWMTNFWLLFNQLVPLLFIVALALNWKDTVRRKYILYPFLALTVIRIVTFTYIIPELNAILSIDYSAALDKPLLKYDDTIDPVLQARFDTWEALSNSRLVIKYMLSVILLIGLTKPFEKQEKVKIFGRGSS